MNRNDRKNRNNGSTLIMVIVAIAFIGILGSLVISMTMINIQMKTIDAQSRENFYSTEAVMQDVKSGLEEIAASEMSKAYENVLLHYVEYTNNGISITNEFDKQYLEGVRAALVSSGSPIHYDPEKIRAHITNTTTKECFKNDSSTPEMNAKNTMTLNYSEKYLKLDNIKVELKNENNGQLTTIETDILIYPPEMSLETSAGYPEFSNYVLIANDSVETETGNYSSSIRGDVYAGANGVQCTNGSLGIVGNMLVTRGNVSVYNNARLYIGGATSGTNVWAENITTEKKSSSTTESASLEIIGTCYVSNDLMLNAPKSVVALGGKYYGYSFNEKNMRKDEPDYVKELVKSNYSSAILINGKDCALNLGGLTTLSLVGRSFVAVPFGTGKDDIAMGQSIGAKSDQTMYLVQREYMKAGANPVMATSGFAEDDQVSYSLIPSEISNLLSSKKVKTITHIFNGNKMVYYYWDFKDNDAANAYFSYMYNKDKEKFDELLTLNVDDAGNGIVMSGTPIAAGYMYSYQPTVDGTKIEGSPYANSENPDATLVSDCVRYAMEYKSRQLALIPNSSSVDPSDIRLTDKTDSPLFDTIISKAESKTVIESENESNASANGFSAGIKQVAIDFENDGLVDAWVVCVDNDGGTAYQVSNFNSISGRKKGIIIATGDVNVGNDFEGMIIAKGKVTISSATQLQTDVTLVQRILQYGIDHYSTTSPNSNFIHYFEKYKTGTAPTGMNTGIADIASKIKFSNWKKNDD